MEITEIQTRVYQIAKDHGFHSSNINENVPTKLMLIVSEISEAMEAHRKGKFANLSMLVNKDLERFEETIKDTFEDELADAVIRILDLAEMLHINLDKHIELKTIYNSKRPIMHGNKLY